MAEQAQAVRQALALLDAPARVEEVAKCFLRAKRDRVAELLETLVGLGQARVTEKGEYVGADTGEIENKNSTLANLTPLARSENHFLDN